ncbi:MAG: uncharacterized protein JWO06_2364 [Bacteroidota bacterium]|nr:uncharacterized protein [Bacteroidota bacterium]
MKKIFSSIILFKFLLQPVCCQPTAKTDSLKWIEPIYVVDPNGIDLRLQAGEESELDEHVPFGTKLEIHGEQNGWLVIQKPNFTQGYLLYGKKESTGNEAAMPLSHEILNDCSEPNRLDIIPIGKQQFLAAKKTSINYLVADTNLIKKQDSVLELKTKAKPVKFTDHMQGEGYFLTTYKGQYKVLNKYVISGIGYEEGFSMLIDKTTGNITYFESRFPYLSASKKYVMCIYTNIYENTTDLQLDSLAKDTVISLVRATYKNWQTADENPEMFWGRDECFYAAVVPSAVAWVPDRKREGQVMPNTHFRYIKIRIVSK